MGRPSYQYCPYCAAPLQARSVAGHVRPACSNCRFVQFDDPKVAVTAAIEHEQKLLLIRRANDPGKGLWALPGGYMDAGELPEAALRREIMEEVTLSIDVQGLLAIHPLLVQDYSTQGIVLVYRATLADPHVSVATAQDDAAEACWFTADQLPPDLAFASTREVLDQWAAAVAIQKDIC